VVKQQKAVIVAMVVLPLAKGTGLDTVKLRMELMLSKSGKSDADGTGPETALFIRQ
jgi:hypothetical protein